MGALQPVEYGGGFRGGHNDRVDEAGTIGGGVPSSAPASFWAPFRVSPGGSFWDSFWVPLGAHFGSPWELILGIILGPPGDRIGADLGGRLTRFGGASAGWTLMCVSMCMCVCVSLLSLALRLSRACSLSRAHSLALSLSLLDLPGKCALLTN